jgi:hypothetical protein
LDGDAKSGAAVVLGLPESAPVEEMVVRIESMTAEEILEVLGAALDSPRPGEAA